MEKYELYAYVPCEAVWEEAVFAGLLERDESGRWKGTSSNKVFTQEELNKVVKVIPNNVSFNFPAEESEEGENDIHLPMSEEQAFGRIILVRKYEEL